MDLIKFSDLIDKGSFDKGIRAIVEDLELITVAIEESQQAGVEFAQIIGKQLKKEIASLSSTSKKLAKDMANMENKMKQFKQTTSNTKKVISDYEKANKKLEKELEKVKKELAQVNVETKKNTQTTASASKANKTMAQTLLGIGGGAALAYRAITVLRDQLRLAVQSTLEFEQAMKEVQAISRASAEELKLLTENANRLGATTEKTAGEIAKLQKELGKLGFNTAEILASTDAIVDLSTATGEDLANSATVAAATLRAFGLEATEMGRVIDVMAGSFVRSGLDLEKFRESMKLVAPIARATGVDVEVTTAALSKLADAGLSGSLAGTALRNLLSTMADPAEKLTKLLGKLNGTLSGGVKSSDDFVLALKELKEANIDLETAVTMVDVRARPAFFTLVDQARVIEGLTEEYRDLNGEASKIADTMRDTLTNDIKIASSAFDAARRNLVEAFIPSLRVGAQETAKFSEFMRFLIDDIRDFGESLSGSDESIVNFITRISGLKLILSGLIGTYNDYIEQSGIDEIRETNDELSKSIERLTIQAGKEVSVITALRKNLDEGKSLDGLTLSLKNLGVGYEDLLRKLDEGGDQEKIAGRLLARLEDNLKNAQSVLEIQQNRLTQVKQELEVLDEIRRENGLLTEEQLAKQTKLDLERQLLQDIVDENTNIIDKLDVVLEKKQIEAGFDKNLLEGQKDKNNELKAQLKLEQQIAETKLQGEIDLVKQRLSDESDPLKRIKLLEELFMKEMELINLSYKFEQDILEKTESGEANYLLKRELNHIEYLNKIKTHYNSFLSSNQKEEEKVATQMSNFLKERAKQSFEAFDKNEERKKKKAEKDREEEERAEQEKWDNIQKTAQVAARGLSRITTSIYDNRQLARENELEAIRQWEERRLALVGDNERAQLVIKEETARREKAIRVQQAKDNKAEAMFQIVIDTAQAVMATLGQTGAFGIPLSAIVGALGAVQLAVVASQPLPQFAKGTKNSPEGLAEVGERGRELIVDGKTGRVRVAETRQVDYLTKGSIVVPNAQTEALFSGQSIDRNSIAFEALSKLSPRQSVQQTIDYDKLGNVIVNGIKNVPKNETYFDENGVRNYIVKGSMRLQKLNKRRGY